MKGRSSTNPSARRGTPLIAKIENLRQDLPRTAWIAVIADIDGIGNT